MGPLEEISRKRKKRADIQRIVLGVVGMVGVLSVGLVAPNALAAFDKLGLLPNPRRLDSIRRAQAALVKKGLLVWEGNKLRLTQKGKRRLQSLELRDYQIPTPKRWDGKWRVLIFDIPERRKGVRDKVRQALVRVGFIRLQDSVWIFPYDCEELMVLLKADFKIGKDMLYMIVELLEYDRSIRDHFGLE